MPATAYVTIQDMEDFLGQDLRNLLNVAQSANITANATLGRAISTANSLIDDSLRKWYVLPLPRRCPALTDAGVAIAKYKLVSQFCPERLTDGDAKAYDDAKEYLHAIVEGTIALDFPMSARFETAAPSRLGGMGSSVTRSEDPNSASRLPAFAGL